ncbi:DUF3800 domain-containing protein [Ancylothrix sp. C2]|uniref:DUF3800 domain-containing protein n=1 Tax=Ancylothrix sp. D3o TaxID=2953691 RepID=UPI0021BAA2A4|nr:DUF3800 domain-containing protein [Ancylothrix sp. D3o]MCT7952945.1 DUF3800 domain-containing protein [Ancylothrix sp. D3o]
MAALELGNSQQSIKKEFALFLDESGSPKPNPKDQAPYFAVGGVLVERKDELVIEQAVSDFKARWSPQIDQDTPLHGSEIRSKKKNFAWLGKLPQDEYAKFMGDLTTTIVSCPITVHACVTSRQGYINRYLTKYGQGTWEMMRSAFSIVIERAAKYAATQNGSVMVYFEKAGKNEDKLITSYFNDLRSQGHPFDQSTSSKYSPLGASQLSQLLRGIEGKTKNNAILQIADLCLYPTANSKNEQPNLAFSALNQSNRIVDNCLLPNQIEEVGIKYYCFDNV